MSGTNSEIDSGRTGREATEPNLQFIPAPRTEVGDKVREAFRSDVIIDVADTELRMFWHLTNVSIY